ncbi:MAG: hypothetical protein LBB52_06355 [Desulfovibrio sp.]|jgi:hypothetical protein|nr:hypothetical protein [Desulfovibrio sp.]
MPDGDNPGTPGEGESREQSQEKTQEKIQEKTQEQTRTPGQEQTPTQGKEQEQTPGQGQDKSLMSRTAAEGDKEGGKDGEKKPEEDGKDKEGRKDKEGGKDKEGAKEDPAAKVPDTPEGYELKFAPETTVDADLLAGFRKTAHELGLTLGQAQALGSLYEGQMKNAAERFVEAQTKHLLDARKAWEAEIAKSPAFEADLGLIQGALRQFGDQELYDLLDQTNLGSHPKMFAFMAKVGKALAEPGFHGERAGGAKTAAEVLYPKMNR